MHGRQTYPLHKEESDLDIELEDKTGDKTYLHILQQVLPKLIADVQPDFAFYFSGVDVLNTDRFGKLALTVDGCKQRDHVVFSLLKQHHIPCTVAMGGGYSPDVKVIVDTHCNTFARQKKCITCINAGGAGCCNPENK